MKRAFLLLLAAMCGVTVLRAGPVPVRLERTEAGWRLLRGGQPFYIHGAGGNGSLALLKESGGNSVRTWAVEKDARKLLDEAHQLGLTVTLGLWLGHERHGFSYTSFAQVAQQIEQVRRAVLEFKDHPALLLWALGNETEGYAAGDNPAIWSHIESLAAMVKQLDPQHPTMTVIAEIGGNRVEAIHKLCPNLDIVGINAYGGATSLAARYREQGGAKPFIVTEFGPPGAWEVRPDPHGLKDEPSSTAKAAAYWNAAEALRQERELCLGSYVFLWGHKMEFTATWFGMLLPAGERLGAADTMREFWSGRPPTNRCPRLHSLTLGGEPLVKSGDILTARVSATDPEGDALEIKWVLMEEAAERMGGDFQPLPADLSGVIQPGDATSATFRAPEHGGVYRLYAYVRDGRGGAAVDNVPFKVEGPVRQRPALKAELPLLVFSDAAGKLPYAASGWMGATEAIMMDENCLEQPKEGDRCLRVEYRKNTEWAGAVWQHPPNDWGDQAGGFDLRGAKRLTFWARGARGGEKVKFGYGLIGPDKPFPDTAREEQEFTLTKEWEQFDLGLEGKDLSRIKSGFVWAVAGQGMPVTFFLDDIRYVR